MSIFHELINFQQVFFNSIFLCFKILFHQIFSQRWINQVSSVIRYNWSSIVIWSILQNIITGYETGVVQRSTKLSISIRRIICFRIRIIIVYKWTYTCYARVILPLSFSNVQRFHHRFLIAIKNTFHSVIC